MHLPLEELRVQSSLRSLLSLPSSATVSTSCHTLSEIEEVDALHRENLPPDYAFVSPVYPSISKPGYSPVLEFSNLSAALKQARIPLVALGGIERERFDEVEHLGFSGAALLGAIWNSSDPFQAWDRNGVVALGGNP